MNPSSELVTVYRSADVNADQDAVLVREKLEAAGFHPAIVDDKTPGVVKGTFEVRVPPTEAKEADTFINSRSEEELEEGDESHNFDLVTVAATDGAISELDAQAIQSLLDANNIDAVIVGTTTLPNLGFEIRVPKTEAERAAQIIREAREAGPEAAMEAEAETEGVAPPEA